MRLVANVTLSTRAVARRLLALSAAVGLLAGGLAFPSAPVTAAGVPVLALTKSLPVPGPFLRQQNFVYSMAYSCSSLETACLNATLVDTLPPNLEFVSATSTSSPSTFSQVGQVVTWTFTSDLGDSSIGLVAGTTGNVDITVRFANSAVDGETANNCATLSATGAVTPPPACAMATAVVPRDFSVAGSKAFTAPFTTGTGGTGDAHNGVAGQAPRTSVTLTAKVTGDQAAASLTITDASDGTDPFDKFDLVSFLPVTLPAGVQAMVTVWDGTTSTSLPAVTNGGTPNLGAIAPGTIRRVSVTFSPVAGPPATLPLGANFVTVFQLQLRDALRSNPAAAVGGGGISNCASIVATYPGFADVTQGQLCDTYNVIPQSSQANGTKTFTPASGVQMSGQTTTVAVAGINQSNIPASQMVVEDPTDSTNPFATFDFGSFNPLVLPAGVTADVAVFVSGSWTTVGTVLAGGATPVLGSVAAADVRGVRFTYNGVIAAGATISNSFALALRDTVRGTATPVPTGAINNCQTTSITTTDSSATSSNHCATFNVTPGTRILDGSKGFNPSSGVIGLTPSSTTVLTINAKNASSSTLAIANMTVTDPGVGSGDTFDIFDFVSFGPLAAANGTTWFVDARNEAGVWIDGTVAYANAQMPALAAGVTAADVTGVRYRLASGSLGANQGITSPINLTLRKYYRNAPATAVPGGLALNNVVDISSTQANTVSRNSAYTTVANSYALTRLKGFSSIEGIAGTGPFTTATLTTTIGGNTPLTTLVVTEPGDPETPNFFEKFKLTGFGTLTVPAGATSTVVEVLYDDVVGYTSLAGGATPVLPAGRAQHVIGVRITVTGNLLPGSNVVVPLQLQLLDNERTGGAPIGAQTITNCYDAVGTPTASKETPKNNCANYVVKPQSTGVGGTKTLIVDQGTELSNQLTTATIDVGGTGNVGLPTIVVTEPAPGNDFFERFDFSAFGAFDFPGTAPTSTVRALVEVTTDGTTWISVDKVPGGGIDLFEDGNIPALSQAVVAVTAVSVIGVRFTYTSTTGALPFRATGINATNRLRGVIVFELRETLRSNGNANLVTPPSRTETNCARYEAGLSVGDLCDTFQINARSYAVTRAKAFTSPSGIAGTGATTTANLVTTIGGNSALSSLVITEPADPATPNPFEQFNLVSLGTITVQQSAANTTAVPGLTISVEVDYDNDALGFVALPGGATPTISPSDAVHVMGIRVTINGSLVNPNAAKVALSLQLRDQTRTGSTPITGGTVTNCYDAVGTPVASKENPKSNCANYVITPRSYSVSQAKSLSPSSGVAGLAPTTRATLTATNTGNVGLDTLTIVENDSGNDPNNFFAAFRLTGFGNFSMPANVQAVVELSTDGTTYLPPLAAIGNGFTPNVGATDLSAVQRIRITYSATSGSIAPSAALVAPFDLVLASTLRGTSTAVVAGPLKNCYLTTFSPAGSLTGDPCATFTVVASTPGASDLKTWTPSTANRDAVPRPTSSITIGGRNSGVVPATSLTLQDPAVVSSPNALSNNAFDYFDFTGFGAVAFPQGADRVQTSVLTADGVWHTGSPSAALPAANALPGGVAAGDVVGFRFTFTNAGGGTLPPTASNLNSTVRIEVSLRAHPRSNPVGQVPLGVITNTSNAAVTTPFGPATTLGTQAQYTITAGQLTIVPEKRLGTGASNSVNPNDTIVFLLQLKNIGTRNLVQPVIVDRFGSNLSYDSILPFPAGGYQIDFNGNAPADVHLSAPTVDTTVAGQVTFTFGPQDYVAPGQTVFLKVALTVKPALPAGTIVTNDYGITTYANTVDLNGTTFNCSPGNTGSDSFNPPKKFCVDSETLTVKQARGLTSLKEVRGEAGAPSNIVVPGGPCPDSAGYTYYPCVASTVVNGDFSYRLSVNDNGNVAMQRALVIDYLPRVGDIGVNGTGPRFTAWTPTLNSVVTISGTLGVSSTVYYSTMENPCTTPLTTGVWTCGGWTNVPPADLATVKAIGVDVVYGIENPLAPGSGFQLGWTMKAPSTAPPVGSIAWNSFAYSGQATDQTTFLLPAEPRKVGIRLVNPSVGVVKSTLPAGLDQDFTFTLEAVGNTTAVPGSATQTANPSESGGRSGVWSNLQPGGTYALTETARLDYTSGTFVCTNTAADGALIPTTPSPGGVQFVAPAGAVISCAITNSLKPVVVVKKATVGGNGTFDFTLSPTQGSGSTKQVDTAPSGSGQATWDALVIGGSYTLAETTPTTWESTFIACTDANGEPFGSRQGNVAVLDALPAGAVITCSFANSLKPIVRVAKTTIGGASPTAFEFTLTGAGGSTLDVIASDEQPGTATWIELTVGGSYTITETADNEWESSFVSCTDVSTDPATPVKVTGVGLARSFVAGAGQVIECGYINSQKPIVTVTKSTAGVSEATDFTFTLTGGNGGAMTVAASDSASGSATWTELVVGGEYTIAEGADAAFTATFNGCVDTATSLVERIDTVDETDGTISFVAAAGATIECSFLNELKPTVVVRKQAIGGSRSFDFTLTGDGIGVGGTTNIVPASPGTNGVATWTQLVVGGTYTLTESTLSEWARAFVGCENTAVAPSIPIAAVVDATTGGVTFVAAAGAVIECEFVNSLRPTVSVQKTIIGAANGEGFRFTLNGLDNAAVPAGEGTKVWDPRLLLPSVAWSNGLTPGGRYVLTELGLTGWSPSFEGCTGTTDATSALNADGGISVTFTAAAGANVSCSFINTDISAVSPPFPPAPAPPSPPAPLPLTGSDTLGVLILSIGTFWVGVALVLFAARRRRHLA